MVLCHCLRANHFSCNKVQYIYSICTELEQPDRFEIQWMTVNLKNHRQWKSPNHRNRQIQFQYAPLRSTSRLLNQDSTALSRDSMSPACLEKNGVPVSGACCSAGSRSKQKLRNKHSAVSRTNHCNWESSICISELFLQSICSNGNTGRCEVLWIYKKKLCTREYMVLHISITQVDSESQKHVWASQTSASSCIMISIGSCSIMSIQHNTPTVDWWWKHTHTGTHTHTQRLKTFAIDYQIQGTFLISGSDKPIQL